MNAKPFLDTNILVYAFATNDPRAATAEALMAAGGVISVQVLNEFVNVSRKKLGRSWPEIEEMLEIVSTLLEPAIALSGALHKDAVTIARQTGLSFYDALIVAAANQAGCDTLFSEDMQDGQTIGVTAIRNPFTSP